MTWLWAQSLALLLLAYFVGAALACFMRRAISAGRATVPAYERAAASARDAVPAGTAALRRVDPLPEVVQARGLASRLERSMTGETNEQPRPAPQPMPALKPAPVVQPMPEPKTVPVTAAAVAKAAPAMPVPPVAPLAPAPVRTLTPAAMPSTTGATAPATAAMRAGLDDLKRIRGIDASVETALNRIGVNRYDQIALWQKPDVGKINSALGFRGRIEHENWIEQAQILAIPGGETEFSRRYSGSGVTLAQPTPDSGQRRPLPAAPAAATPAVASTAMSAGLAAAGAAAMAAAATTARAAPAMATAAPAAQAPSAQLKTSPTAIAAGTPDVEQRAAFAASTTAAPPSARAALQPAAAEPSKTAVPAATAAAAPVVDTQPAPALAPAQPIRPASAARDALQRIGGINAEIERQLAGLGISRYAQISGWSKSDVEKVDGLLGMPGRIARENWIEQAQILGRGGDTAYSRDFDRRSADASRDGSGRDSRPARLADAIRGNAPRSAEAPAASPSPAPRSDIGALRSVRSEAYRGSEQASGPATSASDVTSPRTVRSMEPSDLKRIRGIGVLLERKLNSHGIASYGQIANWAANDIERVGQTLGFPGRIERENWVEQARILASGGTTEFSSRFDRGEVDVARPRGT